MNYYRNIVFTVYLILAFVQKIKAQEATAPGNHTTTIQCHVCWSLESAAQCQHSSKSEPCNPHQLEATGKKLRLIHPHTPEQGSTNERLQLEQYRCFTLSASAGKGEAKKVFYAKGCTMAANDPCSNWAKEKSASCSVCKGNNCNAPMPVDISHVAIKASKKNCTASNSSTTAENSRFYWIIGMAIVSSRCSSIFN
ncbi:uncharacterized protein LOC133391234 [Anopheles gambiae]|uniref:uncharacterized protein LOC133391234 n=1 Tax=Anopheles gambiae TaxID=7165 RepID=UPI002AC89632|nr:uncharacterized protein LOC133391234 [Anopheles gambiae]